MTDIRQHLPLILGCIRQHIADPDAIEVIRAQLRERLPASYGIGAGRLVFAQGERSQPLDIVIYDTTIEPLNDVEQPMLYDLRRVLAVVALAHDLDAAGLRTLLGAVASAKLPRPRASQAQGSAGQDAGGKKGARKSGPGLKKLLPLGIVAYQRLLVPQAGNLEAFALALDALLKEQEAFARPDYLLALSHEVFYTSPQLTGGVFVPSTINIAREPALKKPHPCYVCKQPSTYAHFFYRHLCLCCGDLNYQKRAIPADLTGRIALVTGARVKIGYATALRLLRAGARVIVTTRFPHDAAYRYSCEADFADWQDRLEIYGLDFRYLPVLEHFVQYIHEAYPALDILINNAAQTVRHPLEYYAPLLPREQAPLASLTPGQQALVRRSHEVLPPTPFARPGDSPLALPTQPSVPRLSSSPDTLREILPPTHEKTPVPSGAYDEQPLQRDTRARNSWTLPFNEIDLTEFLEVQTINATAPFLLVSQLHPLMCRSPFAQRFIVNVSAIEGQFASTKLGKHVHTNMAKAALNMLTHTAAAQLAKDGIFMNSVDPGWISQQAPQRDAQTWERLQQLLPLDLIDAAARVCDPIFAGVATGEAAAGCFYKDYQLASW